MKFQYFFIFCCAAFLIQFRKAESACKRVSGYSNNISYTSETRRIRDYTTECWQIQPPKESIVHLKFVYLDLNDPYCDSVYINLTDYTGRKEKVCNHYYYDKSMVNKTISMVGAVDVTLVMKYTYDYVKFLLEYDTESAICASKNHFRCSAYKCIRREQVCDGIEDCEDGLDESECGISNITGVTESRINAINWLMAHQKNYGWGRNTHRALTSLFLTDGAKFTGHSILQEIAVKQLQLKVAASLLRNSTEPLSVNEISMYLNALTVTCHNVRNIFSKDLLKILANHAFSTSPASPGAYLTLCINNWPFSKENVYELLNLLTKDSEYPFALEIQAMTVMALSCLNQKTTFLHSVSNASSIYNDTIKNLMSNQKKDGSFGNVHTTAMVMQALIASGQAENNQWNLKNGMLFLMKSLNSSTVDFLSVYLTLPLFKGKTLADVNNAHCLDRQRKLEDEEDILDIADKVGAKIHIQYSLYIGDDKNVIHNMFLKVPENSTVYDVMKIAQIADPKYKFSYHDTNGHVYIYEIAGLSNDMEAGKFWLFYITSGHNTELNQFTQSPDQVFLRDKEHLILWYKSASI